MLDPYLYEEQEGITAKGGDLYFNLGEISEDVLKDGKKFYENGLPVDGDRSRVDSTVWGLVPKQQSTVYAFDNTSGARARQDSTVCRQRKNGTIRHTRSLSINL